MFKIKFPTKRIFRIFPILRINGMAPFCNLFMERPSYKQNNVKTVPNYYISEAKPATCKTTATTLHSDGKQLNMTTAEWNCSTFVLYKMQTV